MSTPTTLEDIIAALDDLHARLAAAPVAVRAEGYARLYRALKLMCDTANEARHDALFDYLAGLYREDVVSMNEALADVRDAESPVDLLTDDDETLMIWHDRVRWQAYKPTYWTVRLGRRSHECFSSAAEVFTIATRVRERRIGARRAEERRAARKAARERGLPA